MIRPRFNKQDIHNAVQRQKQAIEAIIIRRFKYLAERCVAEARSLNSYKDQTGNLRSSIGYILTVDGYVVAESFDGDTEMGKNSAKKVAEEAISKVAKNKIGLVVVAGMSYAVYVESTDRPVLITAEDLAKREAPKILAKIDQQLTGR